ncbi:hypothetical protein E2C01_048544 [Portunus trituberculatus]|uniref:Uncharacterized protein n=1 Tax=Portunus trituberculatus TaxID=210409 RepID=A0A5B7G446_PORTR|nr:hypothetical protein [Portunus trituberculatus]
MYLPNNINAAGNTEGVYLFVGSAFPSTCRAALQGNHAPTQPALTSGGTSPPSHFLATASLTGRLLPDTSRRARLVCCRKSVAGVRDMRMGGCHCLPFCNGWRPPLKSVLCATTPKPAAC